jgi:putative MATE family efflux protein
VNQLSNESQPRRTANDSDDSGRTEEGDDSRPHFQLSIRSAVFWLALPVLGEQFLNLIVGLVDTFLAGGISKEATAAVGLAAYVGWLVSMLFGLVGTGTTALVSRATGAHDPESAKHFTNQSMIMACGMGVLGFFFIYVLAPTFATSLGMRAETARLFVQYQRIDAIGMVLASVTLIGAAAMRGSGDTRTPMLIMALVNAVNIIVSFALVGGWFMWAPLGVVGIAWGTVVARCTGGIIMWLTLSRRRGPVALDRRHLRVRVSSILRILRIGLPAAAESLVVWTGHFIFMMLVYRLDTGDAATAYFAAHTVGIRVESLSYMPAFAWSVAAATLVGQSLGAGKPDQAQRMGHEAAKQGVLLVACMGVAYFFFAEALFRFFTSDPAVQQIGVPALRFLAFFQPCLAVTIIYFGSLRGAGDTRFPLLFSLLGIFFVRVPLAYLFGIHWQMGLLGTWMGMAADLTVRALLGFVRFVHGGWRSVKI